MHSGPAAAPLAETTTNRSPERESEPGASVIEPITLERQECTMATVVERPTHTAEHGLRFLWLDITRQCQAGCGHCYNSSGPSGTSGDMTREDWLNVLDQAAEMGVQQIQLIGGEPLLHSDLPELVGHALDLGLTTEIFSNLIHVRKRMWPVLRRRGVTLATSFHSDDPAEHRAITHHGSHGKIVDNIAKALRLAIPLRVGIIRTRDDQRIAQAEAMLRAMGVQSIGIDHQRAIGRAAEGDTDVASQLCGHCTRRQAAALPDGTVAGCTMSAGLGNGGNVHTSPLTTILHSRPWQAIAERVPPPRASACAPETCTPKEDSCQPSPGIDPFDAPGGEACVPQTCTSNEDSCQPSSGIDPFGPSHGKRTP
ncbi:radical SAM/SPASM domain-containing protein [Embleya sp. NPDC127516]|uniref:radical SAM/SPASM domain-containing protein n=1 Tax=Embleya sp. NPDC127516 TaxID=3363990 RepID=UPI00381F0289